ncbi:unnamed protein product, partial [Prorocentrum cordatum]
LERSAQVAERLEEQLAEAKRRVVQLHSELKTRENEYQDVARRLRDEVLPQPEPAAVKPKLDLQGLLAGEEFEVDDGGAFGLVDAGTQLSAEEKIEFDKAAFGQAKEKSSALLEEHRELARRMADAKRRRTEEP